MNKRKAYFSLGDFVKKVLAFSAKVFLCLFAILLFISYSSPLFNINYNWLNTILGLIFPLLLPINFVILIIALIYRTKFAIISILALAFATFFLPLYFKFSKQNSLEGDLKVVTYNVGKFAIPKKDTLAVLKEISLAIKKENPDIIAFQEFYKSAVLNLDDYAKKYFPGYKLSYFFPNRSGNVVLTKFEIVSQGHLRLKNTANIVMYNDLRYKGKMLRLYNCHLESYSIAPQKEIEGIEQDKKNIFRLLRKMKGQILKRQSQVAMLEASISTVKYPTMVIGDLNDSPFSYTYKSLSNSHLDSFKEAGSGLGATFSLLYPWLRIDYIFAPKQYKVLNHRVIFYEYSDHYPLIASFDTSGNK